MQNCQEKCLFPGCTTVYSIYANYSRFHGICLEHFIQYSPQDYTLPCEICNNTIRVYGYLPERDKGSSKLSTNFNSDNFLSQHIAYQREIAVNLPFEENKQETFIEKPIEQAEESRSQVFSAISEEIWQRNEENSLIREEKPIVSQEKESSMIVDKSTHAYRDYSEPCQSPQCKAKHTVKVCSKHFFCKNHIEKYEGFYLCMMCKCSKCNKCNAFAVKCGRSYCINCYPKRNCCCICCKICKKEPEECKHFLCDDHCNKYFCICKTCAVCRGSPVKKRTYGKLLCDSCFELEIIEIEKLSNCSLCNQKTTSDGFFCQEHFICKKCEEKCKNSYINKECNYRCNKKYSCKICSSYLKVENFTCNHQVCNFCRKKSKCADCS